MANFNPSKNIVVFAVHLIMLICATTFVANGAAPTITWFTPTSGPIGSSVTITGTGFNTTADSNIVFFGATRATVTAAGSTSLTVTVPTGATYQFISVTNLGNNLTAYTDSPFVATFTNGSLAFAAHADFATGLLPYYVTVGDVDGDGKPDLLVANLNSDNISILRNTSTPAAVSFAPQITLTTGGQPYGISFTDMDGDGKPDIAVVNDSSNTISIFRNTSTPGIISFAAVQTYATGSFPWSIKMGDMDGDGKPDMLVVNSQSNTVFVYRNTSVYGSISFVNVATLTTGSNPLDITVGDIDGDGKPDVAVVNWDANSIYAFHNVSTPGNIAFGPGLNFDVGSNPRGLAFGDIDGDGKPDLSIANGGDGTITVLRNISVSGTINFAAQVTFETGCTEPWFVSLGDINGDGKPDLETGSGYYQNDVLALLKNTSVPGTISFAAEISYFAGEQHTSGAIGDIDGDGKPDIAVVNYDNNTVSVLLQTGPPTITVFSPTSGPIGTTVTITGTGFNATADSNIVFFGATQATVSAASGTRLTVTVPSGATYQYLTVTNLRGNLTAYSDSPFIVTFNGEIAFTPKHDITSGTNPQWVMNGDLDGDGKPDLAVVNFGNLSVYRNISTPGVVAFDSGISYATGNRPMQVAIADLDGDGKLDLAVTNEISNTVSVYRNISSSGNIAFASQVIFATGTGPYFAATGDIDGDGKTDLIIVNRFSNSISLLRNTSTPGNLSFATRDSFLTGSIPPSAAIGDLDGDGKPDIAVANYGSNNISVFRNISGMGSFSLSAPLTFTTGLDPYSIAIADVDGDGKPDLLVSNVNSNTVSVLRNVSGTDTIKFAAKIDFPTGSYPQCLTIGDIDGDGKPDIAVANLDDNTISVLHNISSSGTVNFASGLVFSTDLDPWSLQIGDVDGDGKPDIAIVNDNSNTASILLQEVMPQGTLTANGPLCSTGGTGQLTWTATAGTGPFTVVYNDGVANRTDTNVVSGVPFNVYTNPVTANTTYTLVSVQYPDSAKRTSGFNTGSATISLGAPLSGNLSGYTTPVCYNGSPGTITATGAGGDGAYTYLWYSNGVSTGVTSRTYSPDSLTGTSSFYCAITSGSCGNINTPTAIINVTAPSSPPTGITGTLTVCSGSGTTLTETGGSLGSGATYQWGTGSVIGSNPIAGATGSACNVTPSNTTNYWVSVTGVAPCGSPSGGATATVTVNTPSSAPTGMLGGGGPACIGETGATFTVTGGSLGTGATYQWGTGDTIGINPISGATGNGYSVTPTVSTTYWVSVTGAAPCGSPAGGVTKTLTVIPNPTVSAGGAISSVCQGGTTSALGGSFGGSATGAIWADGGAGGTFANNAGTTPGTTTYTASVSSPATVTLILTTTGGGCGTTSASKTVRVNPNPTVSAGPALSSICEGGTTADLGGSFGPGATAAIWTDGGAGGTFANNGGTTPGTATYTASASSSSPVTLTLTTSGGTCGTVSASKTVIVAGNNTADAPSGSPTLCMGTALNAISIATTGATGIGNAGVSGANGLPAGVYASWASNVITISGTPTAWGNFNYSIPLTGGCGSVNATGTIDVNPIPVVTTPNLVTISTGNSPNILLLASLPSSFTWTIGSVTGGVTGDSSGAGNTINQVLTYAQDTGVGTVVYNVKPRGTQCTGAVYAITVVVTPPVINVPVSVCPGGSVTVITPVNGDTAPLIYEWQYRQAGSWATVQSGTPFNANYTDNNAFGAIDTFTIGGIADSGTYLYRCYIGTATGKIDTSHEITVTVLPTLGIAQQPQSVAPVCTGGSAQFNVGLNQGIPVSYQWQLGTGGNWQSLSPVAPYSGTGTDSLKISGIANPGTYRYRCLITATAATNCGTAVSDTVSLTVVSSDSFVQQPADTVSMCVAGAVNLSVSAAGGTPSIIYQWQYDSLNAWKNVNAGWPANAGYTGQTTDSLQVSGISVDGSYPYRCIISSAGSGCRADTSNTAVAGVYQQPVITTGPPISPAPVCTGGSVTLAIVATGAPLEYQWQTISNGEWADVAQGYPAAAVYTGINSNTLVIDSIDSVGTYPYRCQVSSAGNHCDTATSRQANVQIVAQPAITQQPVSPPPSCVTGADTMNISAAGGTPVLMYQWQVYDSLNSAWQAVNDTYPTGALYYGNNTSILTVKGILTPGNYLYRCIAGAAGSGCINANSDSVPVVVAAQPSVALEALNPGIICGGGTAVITGLVAYGGEPTLNYQWQYDSSGNWRPVSTNTPSGANYPDDSISSLTVTGINVPGSYYYRCVLSATGSGCGTSITSQDTVQVSNLIIHPPSVPTAICATGSSSMSLTVSGTNLGNVGYQWQYFSPGSGWSNVLHSPPGAVYTGDTTNALSVTGINTHGVFVYRCWVSSASCSAPSINDTLVVDRNLYINRQPALTQAMCIGGTDTISLSWGGGTGAAVWNWFYRDSASSVWGNLRDGIPLIATYPEQDSLLIEYGIDSPGLYYYRVVISDTSSGCTPAAISDSVLLTVAQQPAISAQSNILTPVCVYGPATVYVTTTGGAPAITYNWQYYSNNVWTTPVTGTPFGATYSPLNHDSLTVSNIDSSSTYIYRCIISAAGNGCRADTGNATVISTAPPISIVTQPVAQMQSCPDFDEPVQIAATGGTPALVYNWQIDSAGSWVLLTSGANYQILGASLDISGIDTPGLYRYRCQVSATGNGCITATSTTVNYQVYANPLVRLSTPDADLCTGDTLQITRTETGAPANVYTLYYPADGGSTWQPIADSNSLITFQMPNAGQFEYEMAVSSTLGNCVADTSPPLLVNVNLTPPAPVIRFDASVICTGSDNIPFAIVNPNPNYAYEWIIGTGASLQLNNTQGTAAEISFNTPGQQALTVRCHIIGQSCYSDTNITINVNSNQSPGSLNIVLTQPGNNLFCLPDSLAGYMWGYESKASDESFVLASGASAMYNLGGNFDTVDNAYWVEACSGNTCCTRQYYNAPVTYTNIATIEGGLIELYPNPTSGALIFKNNTTGYKTCDIYTVQGALIKNLGGGLPGATVTFNIAELAAGSYLVSVSSADAKDNAVMKMIVLIK